MPHITGNKYLYWSEKKIRILIASILDSITRVKLKNECTFTTSGYCLSFFPQGAKYATSP